MPIAETLTSLFGNDAVIELALTGIVALFGWTTKKYSGKYKEIKHFIDEIDRGLEDDRLTKKEIKSITEAAKEIFE